MRDPISVFYYPEMWVGNETLKKAILLFDELHFMDRPAFTFENYGLIGSASPLRQFEASFRENGVPLFVHEAPGGPVRGKFLEQIKADIDDRLFLTRFQDGLRTSPAFRRLHIPEANYGPADNADSIAQKLIGVDLWKALENHESPSHLFYDNAVKHFDLATESGCAKKLVSDALRCSATLNYALRMNTRAGIFPLADARPYGDLLGAKYARAVSKLEPTKNNIQLTDLSFAIFDELVQPEALEKLSFTEVVRYRKASEAAREEFLTFLGAIQAKQATVGIDGDYAGAIKHVVTTEIAPAARVFKNKLKTIHESLFGALAKGTLGFLGTSQAALTIFGDMSWTTLLPLAGAAGAYVGNAAVDAYLAKRAATRECSISYILSLDQ
jgi:hypothetical protein